MLWGWLRLVIPSWPTLLVGLTVWLGGNLNEYGGRDYIVYMHSLMSLSLRSPVRSDHTKMKLKSHDDVIKWKHFPRYWPFVRSPVNSPHKGQWRGALMFSLICIWINGWVINHEVSDLRRYRAHYDVTVMPLTHLIKFRSVLWTALPSLCSI